MHEVHVTWPDGYQLEFLLNEQEVAMGDWVFRRDPRIHRPRSATFTTGHGVPVLAPEIVLLYKAKAPAAKDDADLRMVLPYLNSEQRSWLIRALNVVSPAHPWASILAQDA